MYKKFVHILFAGLLFITTTGFTLNLQFCNQTVKSVSFSTETNSCCENDMCCHNETVSIQYENDYVLPFNEINFNEISHLIDDLYFSFVNIKDNTPDKNNIINFIEPPSHIYKLPSLSFIQVFIL